MASTGDHSDKGGTRPGLPRDDRRNQADFEVEFFSRVLERLPTYVDVLRVQAAHLARRGQYDGSLLLDRRLEELLPENCVVRYNVACSLSRLGRVEEALDALDNALRLGYDDYAHLDSDPDLEDVRSHPRYHAILRRHGVAV
jgi:tetratricopeptide (TPR) repeat protein